MGESNYYGTLLGGLGYNAQQASYNLAAQQQCMQAYQYQKFAQQQVVASTPAPARSLAKQSGDDVAWLKTRVREVCEAWQ